ncbi:MAG: hypothetical protein HWE11_03035 [Gammaproteobacteria bacterium]|nr:hypothetical protein [Gammaproteobacteria bacterium]
MNKHQALPKLMVAVLLILMAAAYFWHMQRTTAAATEPPSVQSTTPNQPPITTTANESTAEETPAQRTLLSIETITFPHVDDVPFDYFGVFRHTFRNLELPQGLLTFILTADLVPAVELLKSEPASPDYHIAIETIALGCSAVKYENEYLAQETQLDENDLGALTVNEQNFFIQYHQRRIDNTLKLYKSCLDLEMAVPLNLEQRRKQLSQLNDSAFASLVSQVQDIKKEQATILIEKTYQERPSHFIANLLLFAYLSSDDPMRISDAVTLLAQREDFDPTIYVAIADCLDENCQEFAKVNPNKEYWLKQAAITGSFEAIRKLSALYRAENDWRESFAWRRYQLALMQKGCYAAAEMYFYDYLKTKNFLNEVRSNLNNEAYLEALELANSLYLEHFEAARGWLEC